MVSAASPLIRYCALLPFPVNWSKIGTTTVRLRSVVQSKSLQLDGVSRPGSVSTQLPARTWATQLVPFSQPKPPATSLCAGNVQVFSLSLITTVVSETGMPAPSQPPVAARKHVSEKVSGSVPPPEAYPHSADALAE